MKLKDDQIYLGEHFLVTFQRTLRIPEDNNEYPLPPGLGSFPVRRVADFAANLPTSWSDDEEALFIPLYQQEALWLSFTAVHWKPNAVMIGIGEINALTGALWQPKLEEQPQNYLVCPEQPWLDGFKVDDSVIRQFVTVPLGQGLAISEQILGSATFGGLRLVVFEPKAGLFPKTLPAALEVEGKIPLLGAHLESVDSQSMGLGAGGKMKQKVYPDPFGINTWDTSHSESVTVYLVNSRQYRTITNAAPPPTPISAQTYTQFGLPWFELYDEETNAIEATAILKEVKPIATLTKAESQEQAIIEEKIEVDPAQIKKLRSQNKSDHNNS